jgi:tape measure domain-containing protein
MATTDQVETVAYRMRFEDQMTAGLKAATEELKRTGVALDATEIRAKKAEKSFGAMVTQIDASAKVALAKARADEQLEFRIARLNAELGKEIKTQEELNRKIEQATRARDVHIARIERQIAVEQRRDQSALDFARTGNIAMTSLSTSSNSAARGISLLGANFGTAGNALMGFASGAGGVAIGLAAIGASALAAGGAIARAGDQATASLARLQSATGSFGAAERAYQGLFELSQRTGVAVAESATSFTRFAIAAKEIGATNNQVLELVRTVQQAGIVAGTSTNETTAATMQLGQALASGRLQGDELRSIMENMPMLGQALARELGVGVGELRKMGEEGKLTADVVFPALLRAGQSINVEFEKMPVTMARAFSILGEAMTRFAADLDRALGLSQGIARAAQAASAAVNQGRTALGLGTPLELATSGYNRSRERVTNLDQQMSNAEAALNAPMPGGTRGMMRRNLETLRQERALAIQELEGFIAQRNRLEREGQEASEAEEFTAGLRAVESQRRRDQERLEELYKALDKDRTIRAEHAQRVQRIDELAARGTINQEEASRLRTIAERERDEGLARLVTRTETARQSIERMTEADREAQRVVQQGVSLAESAATEGEKYEAQVRALTAALNAGRVSQEQFNRATAQLNPAVREARQAEERALQERERLNKQITDDIVRYSADSFADLWSKTGRGFAGLMDSMLQMVRRTFARIAAEAVIRPIVTPIVSNVVTPLMGALGFGGNAAGGIGSMMPSLSGAGSSLMGFLNTPLFGGASAGSGAVTMQAIGAPTGVVGPSAGIGGVTTISAQAGAGGGMTIGGALGAGAAGFGLGMLGGNISGGIRGTANPMIGSGIGAGLGTAAGFALMPVLGPLGPILGGVLGGTAGGLFGPTTKGNASRSGGDVFLGTDANGQLIITGSAGKRFDSNAATAEVQAQLNAINAQIGARGLSFANAGQAAVGFGQASGSPRELSLTSLVGQLRGGNANQMTAFSTLAGRGGNLEQALQAADFISQIFEPLSKAGEQTDSFTAAMNALAKTYDDAIIKARDLGLATEALDVKRAESLAKLRADTQRSFDAMVRGARNESFVDQLMGVRDNFQTNASAYLSAGRDPNVLFAAQVSAIVNNLDVKQLTTAIEALRGVDDVAVLFAETAIKQKEVAESLAKTADALRSALNAGGAISNYLDSLSATSAGGLSPSDQFTNAQSIFGRDLALSRGGDLDALDRITGSAENLLSAGRGMFASGPEFQTLLQMVQSSLANLPATRSYEQQSLDTLTRIANGQQTAVELLGLLSADANRDQRITWPEFEAWTRANEAQTSQLASALGVSNASLASIFTQLDANGDGTLAQLEIQSALASAANNRLDGVLATGTGTVEQLVQQNSLSSALVDLGKLTYSGNSLMAASLAAANENLALGNRYAAATAYNTAIIVDGDYLARGWEGPGGRGPGISISAFAKGGVFDGPIMFPMRDGMGMMGEAGPEAIMPLARGSDGSLGVRVNGGGADGMAKLINGLIAEVAELRAEMRRMADAGERTADATEDTAASNSTMARREVVVGRRAA